LNGGAPGDEMGDDSITMLVQTGDRRRDDNPPPAFWLYAFTASAWIVMIWLLWPR
jgi:hypothetical protein